MKNKISFWDKCKSIKTQIEIYFKSLWFVYVEEPKLIKEKYFKEQKIKLEFEEKRNLKIARIKDLMDYKQTHGNLKKDYYNNKLEEARKDYHTNFELNRYTTKSPFFYEPEICDIHNESIPNKPKLDLRDLIRYENKQAHFSSKHKNP